MPCLMAQVEERSDSGKRMFKTGEKQFETNVTFTLLAIDGLADDGVTLFLSFLI